MVQVSTEQWYQNVGSNQTDIANERRKPWVHVGIGGVSGNVKEFTNIATEVSETGAAAAVTFRNISGAVRIGSQVAKTGRYSQAAYLAAEDLSGVTLVRDGLSKMSGISSYIRRIKTMQAIADRMSKAANAIDREAFNNLKVQLKNVERSAIRRMNGYPRVKEALMKVKDIQQRFQEFKQAAAETRTKYNAGELQPEYQQIPQEDVMEVESNPFAQEANWEEFATAEDDVVLEDEFLADLISTNAEGVESIGATDMAALSDADVLEAFLQMPAGEGEVLLEEGFGEAAIVGVGEDVAMGVGEEAAVVGVEEAGVSAGLAETAAEASVAPIPGARVAAAVLAIGAVAAYYFYDQNQKAEAAEQNAELRKEEEVRRFKAKIEQERAGTYDVSFPDGVTSEEVAMFIQRNGLAGDNPEKLSKMFEQYQSSLSRGAVDMSDKMTSIPAYGNYVGPMWTGGRKNDIFSIAQFAVKPTDFVDSVARLHDMEYTIASMMLANGDEDKAKQLIALSDRKFVAAVYLNPSANQSSLADWNAYFDAMVFRGTLAKAGYSIDVGNEEELNMVNSDFADFLLEDGNEAYRGAYQILSSIPSNLTVEEAYRVDNLMSEFYSSNINPYSEQASSTLKALNVPDEYVKWWVSSHELHADLISKMNITGDPSFVAGTREAGIWDVDSLWNMTRYSQAHQSEQEDTTEFLNLQYDTILSGVSTDEEKKQAIGKALFAMNERAQFKNYVMITGNNLQKLPMTDTLSISESDIFMTDDIPDSRTRLNDKLLLLLSKQRNGEFDTDTAKSLYHDYGIILPLEDTDLIDDFDAYYNMAVDAQLERFSQAEEDAMSERTFAHNYEFLTDVQNFQQRLVTDYNKKQADLLDIERRIEMILISRKTTPAATTFKEGIIKPTHMWSEQGRGRRLIGNQTENVEDTTNMIFAFSNADDKELQGLLGEKSRLEKETSTLGQMVEYTHKVEKDEFGRYSQDPVYREHFNMAITLMEAGDEEGAIAALDRAEKRLDALGK